MSTFNQNSILAHRSVYGNQSQSSSSLTEYKTVSFKKGPPTPRRIKNQAKSNSITHFNEKSRLLLEIAMLRDEITELNKILDEKKKGFTNTELTNIFYFNKDSKPVDIDYSIFQETATLDKKIEDLTEIFDSDSISRLNESNENNKILLHKEQDTVNNKNEQIQIIQDKIKKIRDTDIYREIFEQRKKITEKHEQIHNAVEIHRKLKEELRKIEEANPIKIKDLEDSLLKAKENKKNMLKKFKNIRKQQQKERIEMEAEKLRRSKKFVISTVLQSFDFSKNEVDQEKSIQKSIVSFEKPFNEIESESKRNTDLNLLVNRPKSKKYIQENGILIDSDFEIATQLLSENEEEEYNQNKLIIEEEEEYEENEIIISNELPVKNKEAESTSERDHQKIISQNVNQIESDEEKSDQEENKTYQPKIELVHNSIQCELNIDKNKEHENNNNDDENDKSLQEIGTKYQIVDNIPSLLFPLESEIESTSIIYSESDFSSSQIEAIKKEKKEKKENQSKIFDDQISTEIELNENLVKNSSLSEYDLDNIKESNIGLQSEYTSICNSSIDSEKMIQSDVSSESTSIVTSASDFKFTEMQESFLKREVKPKKASCKKKVNTTSFHNFNDDDQKKTKSNSKREKGIMTTNEINYVTSSEVITLEPSMPVTFESPEISSQPQISTGGNSEYTEYLSSQTSENELDDEIKTNMVFEKILPSDSFISNDLENSSIKSSKPDLIISSASKSEKKMLFDNQKINIQNNFVEYTSSISSSRRKVASKSLNKIKRNEGLSPSSLNDEQINHSSNDYYSSNCQSAALMSASDSLEDGTRTHKNDMHKFDIPKSLKKPIPLLNSRKNKKYSDQSGQYNIENNNIHSGDNGDDVLDNKFIAKDDRKILKIGSFSIKPLKREIMPYFVRFGTVISYVTQQDNSKYFVYIGFKKHIAASNAKKNLNGSKIAQTRLKITWESESFIEKNINSKNPSMYEATISTSST